jgi:hypothetical protein
MRLAANPIVVQVFNLHLQTESLHYNQVAAASFSCQNHPAYLKRAKAG